MGGHRSEATRPSPRFLLVGALAVASLLAVACSSEPAAPAADSTPGSAPDATSDETSATEPAETNPSPGPGADADPDDPMDPATIAALDEVFDVLLAGPTPGDVAAIGETGDIRVTWILSDLLRFFQGGPIGDAAVDAAEQLTGVTFDRDRPWTSVTNQLITWDLPAPPGYLDYKRQPYLAVEPKWQPLFDDPDAAVDWRLIGWGGVLIDDAPPGGRCSRCIPALDDPAVTDAAGGDWYPDDRIVFGVVIDGEARAYPKNIMEVHEMVNDTIGGRRIGLPYCTLCGSAQAFFTDDVPGAAETPLVLRTSGLLSRSNKVMYDFVSGSYFDTFAGVAVSGPLQDAGVELEPAGVQAVTWADWKAAHPETTIVAEDGGLERVYDLDPLRGRDDDGPIFPVGEIDPRLPAQTHVLGVTLDDGTAAAFPVEAATEALADGMAVELGGVRAVRGSAGLAVETADGERLIAHQAFWFAWSQFNPDTLLWEGPG